MNLYTINAQNFLIEWISIDGQSWTNGSLNSHSVVPVNSSNLVAILHRYEGCTTCTGSLLLVYQDSPASLQIGNWSTSAATSSTSGWQWLSPPVSPISGTGLGMSLGQNAGDAPSIMLDYQNKNLALCGCDWNPHQTSTVEGMSIFRSDIDCHTLTGVK